MACRTYRLATCFGLVLGAALALTACSTPEPSKVDQLMAVQTAYREARVTKDVENFRNSVCPEMYSSLNIDWAPDKILELNILDGKDSDSEVITEVKYERLDQPGDRYDNMVRYVKTDGDWKVCGLY
ncbi:hypothetical protein B2J88_35925 [Rhodococcus sp. SRB_17]|nr:hypothetical protein [Rhodococcus sp. SRB_17]